MQDCRGGGCFCYVGAAVNVIEERLAVQDVIVLDGAFATEL